MENNIYDIFLNELEREKMELIKHTLNIERVIQAIKEFQKIY